MLKVLYSIKGTHIYSYISCDDSSGPVALALSSIMLVLFDAQLMFSVRISFRFTLQGWILTTLAGSFFIFLELQIKQDKCQYGYYINI